MQNSIFPLTSIMAADNSGSAFLEQNVHMRTMTYEKYATGSCVLIYIESTSILVPPYNK